jgi:hypothetical protein
MLKYDLKDPALVRMARVIHAADVATDAVFCSPHASCGCSPMGFSRSSWRCTWSKLA